MTNSFDCILCNLELDSEQKIVLENDTCYFIQKKSEQHVLEGSGLIIPKRHCVTVFDLNNKEWEDTKNLLQQAKKLLDLKYSPEGYNVGWNVNVVGGQTIPHAHLHIIPRFKDEPYANKGIRHWIKQPENQRKYSTLK